MKKLLIMFFVSAAFVVFFSFEYSFGSDGSVFSNHGWGGESLSASPSTQLELSAESIATQDEINYALPVAFIQQVSLSAPVDSSQVRYDGTFQSAVRVHQDWLESLPEESLRLKCLFSLS